MKRILPILLLGAFCGISFPSQDAPSSPPAQFLPSRAAPDARLLEGLTALHQGRFSEGQKLFRAFLEEVPADPRGHLFLAFSEWWKLLELRGVADSPEMEFHLQEAIRLAQERLDQIPGDPETLASMGTGYIFLAQYRASQRKLFRAAFAAKKGKAYLEKALEFNPALVDSRFGLGAYNYYADKVNILVKGLRTVMFLPGGNSELGLSQLREVAEKGRYFRTEAHLLLAVIFQGHDERRYLKSLENLRAALDLNPGSPVILMSLGELQIRVGRYPEAQATLQLAIENGLRSSDRDQAEMARFSRILLADSLDLSLHSPAALREVESALEGGPIQPDLRSRALAVAARAAARLNDPASLRRVCELAKADAKEEANLQRRFGAEEQRGDISQRLDPALELMEAEQWQRAERLLEDLRQQYPASWETRFHLARAVFEQGKWKEAETMLREISDETSPPVPAWIRGWRDLYLGRALAAQGKKSEGASFYSKAAQTDGFRAKDLARALLGPEGDDPAVWPKKIFGLGIQKGQDADHVGPGLPEGGNSAVSIDRVLSRVIGG